MEKKKDHLFKPGNKLGGRKPGSLNRSTEEMKLTIARAVNNTLNTISTDLETIRKKDPERAIELALKLMEYSLPKLSRTEMKAEIDQRIHQITVNINQTGSNE
jgi:predicted component of type VI protein secretion system